MTWQWLRDHHGIWASARYTIGGALVSMFNLSTQEVVAFLEDLLDRATIVDLEWIGQLLRSSHHRFIFLHRGFVERYLESCKAADLTLLKRAIDQLDTAATTGSWSGTVGEPMPRDIQARDEATAILASMSRLSPAYALYRAYSSTLSATSKGRAPRLPPMKTRNRCMNTVFWSWQSDLDERVTRNLIREALTNAIADLHAELDERLEVTSDTKGVAGTPDIVATILAKIEKARVFVGDVTPLALSATTLETPAHYGI